MRFPCCHATAIEKPPRKSLVQHTIHQCHREPGETKHYRHAKNQSGGGDSAAARAPIIALLHILRRRDDTRRRPDVTSPGDVEEVATRSGRCRGVTDSPPVAVLGFAAFAMCRTGLATIEPSVSAFAEANWGSAKKQETGGRTKCATVRFTLKGSYQGIKFGRFFANYLQIFIYNFVIFFLFSKEF